MKKLLPLIVFISCSLFTFAQPYQSIFGRDSTTWRIVCYNLDNASAGSFTADNSKITSDGKDYIHIQQKNWLLREDTGTGRVWYKSSTGYCGNGPNDTDEILIQDMRLAVGDTFNIRYSQLAWMDSLKIVDSVFYVAGRKVIRFRPNPQPYTFDIYFTEGIGPNQTPFWMMSDCSPCLTPYLLCTYKDGVQTDYRNITYHGDCDPVLAGIDDISKDATALYPNPANGIITISNAANIKHIDISDAMGRLVSTSINESHDTNINVDIKHLYPGVYNVHYIKNAYASMVRLIVDR